MLQVGVSTFATVAELSEYAENRGIELPVEEVAKESLLLKAMDYLETVKWKGKRSSHDQELAFPRSGLAFDGAPIPSDKIPKQIIRAQCRLACDSMTIDLTPTKTTGGIQSEKIDGAVSVSYFEGNNGVPQFSWFESSLSDFILSVDDGERKGGFGFVTINR